MHMIILQTKAGPVLVAINPFKSVPLYGNECIEAYKRKSIDSPHVYAIADTAIREMIRGDYCSLTRDAVHSVVVPPISALFDTNHGCGPFCR